MYRALRASPCAWSAKNVPVAKRTGPCGSGSWADDVKGSEVGVESPGEMSISCDWRSTLVSSLHDSLSRSRSRSRSRSFSRSLSLAEASSLLLPPLLPPHELQYSRLSDCRDDLPSRIPLLLFERELECLSWPVRKRISDSWKISCTSRGTHQAYLMWGYYIFNKIRESKHKRRHKGEKTKVDADVIRAEKNCMICFRVELPQKLLFQCFWMWFTHPI